MGCKRCGAQIGDNGGVLTGRQVSAAGHAANEMWPFISRIFGDGWQSVAFEATGDEKSASILQLPGINVIGAGISNQGGETAGGGTKLAQLTINRVMRAETTEPNQRLGGANVVAASDGRGPGSPTPATGLERSRSRRPRL